MSADAPTTTPVGCWASVIFSFSYHWNEDIVPHLLPTQHSVCPLQQICGCLNVNLLLRPSICGRKTCDPQVTQRAQKSMQSRPSSWGLMNKAEKPHIDVWNVHPKKSESFSKHPDCVLCHIGLFWPLNYLKHLNTIWIIWIKSSQRIQIPEFQIIRKLSGLATINWEEVEGGMERCNLM